MSPWGSDLGFITLGRIKIFYYSRAEGFPVSCRLSNILERDILRVHLILHPSHHDAIMMPCNDKKTLGNDTRGIPPVSIIFLPPAQ